MRADAIYRIVSSPRLVTEKNERVVKHTYSLEKCSRWLFKTWNTVTDKFETTTHENDISYRMFITYEEAEKYFMQKFGEGNYVQCSGNVYKVWFPNYAF